MKYQTIMPIICYILFVIYLSLMVILLVREALNNGRLKNNRKGNQNV